MGARIDELEQSLNDLKAEIGGEGMSTPSKMKEESRPSDSSA
jgi:heat shock factor-binding protein 1